MSIRRTLPDPTFYASARDAQAAPPETIAYVVAFDQDGALGRGGRADALLTVDVDPSSQTYGTILHRAETQVGDELHHFGWNACSSALCPWAAHPHVERRYLLVPGLRSSNVYVFDTKPDPRAPRLVHTVTAQEIADKAGYSRPHTVHCGPDGIYLSALGNPDGDGPGGIFVLDHDTFAVRGAWEQDRGDQYLAYDFWWHLLDDTAITSEWGTPNQVEGGLQPELLLGGKYGHQLHFWDIRKRQKTQTVDLGSQHQGVLELRPAHDADARHGFVGVVISTEDLSASVWAWQKVERGSERKVERGSEPGSENGEQYEVNKVLSIPAEPVDDPSVLPPALQPFGAVPPLVTDINLSLDDRWLYVSAWGTGRLHRYDVSDPRNPVEVARVDIGGIVNRSPHPTQPDVPLSGGPQMVEVSRDGKRVYVTNSLYASWDEQFYPDGIDGWLARLDAGDDGSLALDPYFLLTSDDGRRLHQVRLEGGDASSDSFCWSS